MRPAIRLLAVVKPARYLEAGNPTGLTGLFNHPAPRSTLLYLYGSILEKLKSFPEHSVYRQSVEAVTKNRMSIIEAIKPEGYDEWARRAAEKIERNPEAFQPGGRHEYLTAGENGDVETGEGKEGGPEWTSLEGTRAQEERAAESKLVRQGTKRSPVAVEDWEPEPALEASQIRDAESQIGGGLIEEVIQVAEGELKLVDNMLGSRVWEELEEKPQPGQWDYFARDQHTPGTQEPPNK
ncbi:hypothetical protein ACLMJK_005181 [Lecanora helva]